LKSTRSWALARTNFVSYSRIWHQVHMTYLQICVEGGIPVLILYLMFFGRRFQEPPHSAQDKESRRAHRPFRRGAAQFACRLLWWERCLRPKRTSSSPISRWAFTATLYQTVKEREAEGQGDVPPPPQKPRHFLEVYADNGKNSCRHPWPLICRTFLPLPELRRDAWKAIRRGDSSAPAASAPISKVNGIARFCGMHSTMPPVSVSVGTAIRRPSSITMKCGSSDRQVPDEDGPCGPKS